MPGTIGIDDATGLSSVTETNAEEHMMTDNAPYVYTAAANDVVSEVGFYNGSSLGDGAGVDVGVYDITSGVNNATLVAQGNVNPSTSGIRVRNAVAITPVALSAGNTYAVAFSIRTATSLSMYRGSVTDVGNNNGTLTGTSALGATWNEGTQLNQLYGVFATVTENAATDTVSPPDPLTDGATAQAYNPSGFASGNITSVTIDGVNVPAFTQTTFDNFDIETLANNAGAAGPAFGLVTFAASNGTESANVTVTLVPKTGYSVTTMAVVDTTTPEYLYALLQTVGLTLATGDEFLLNTLDNSSIADDGGWDFHTLPKTFQYRNAAAGLWYELQMTNNGVIVPGSSLHVSDGTGAPDRVQGGLPFVGQRLAVDSVSAMHHLSNGRAFTANGRLVVSLDGAVDHISGGIPFTADGRMAISEGSVDHFSNGVGFTADSKVAVTIG